MPIPGGDAGVRLVLRQKVIVHWQVGYRVRMLREYIWKCVENDPCKFPFESVVIKFDEGKWREMILDSGKFTETVVVSSGHAGNVPIPNGSRRP